MNLGDVDRCFLGHAMTKAVCGCQGRACKSCVDSVNDFIHDTRFGQLIVNVSAGSNTALDRTGVYRRSVTNAVDFTIYNLAENAAHDLAAPCLWQIIYNEDDLWRRERTDEGAHVVDELLLDP